MSAGLPPFGAPLGPEALRRLVGRAEQAVGAELFERADGAGRGVRVVRLRSGEVEAEVVVDRGLDIAAASIRGVPVAWLSPTGVVGPWYAEPTGWGTLRTFSGGLLTTCGLDHALGPADDDVGQYGYPGVTTASFPLHGRVSVTPATLRSYGLDLDAPAGPEVHVAGEVRQAAVFGEHLLLRRRIGLRLGGRVLRVDDVVVNEGYAPTPHLMLYHVNLGWPLLAPGAQACVPSAEPRVATATGVDWQGVGPPAAGAVEQVCEHVPRVDGDGTAHAALLNPDVGGGRPVGVEVAWDAATLPRLVQWRMLGEGHYVLGLEPTNVPLEGRRAARAAGELVVLQPGEAVRHHVELRLLWGADELAAARERCGIEAVAGA